MNHKIIKEYAGEHRKPPDFNTSD